MVMRHFFADLDLRQDCMCSVGSHERLAPKQVDTYLLHFLCTDSAKLQMIFGIAIWIRWRGRTLPVVLPPEQVRRASIMG